MARDAIIIEGTAHLQAQLAKAGALAPKALEAAAVEEMELVMAEAKTQTPVDTGTLRASGTVLPPERMGGETSITAGFGGAASDYAIVQHERLDLSHTVGTSKFLERPFLARIPTMVTRLAVGVGAALKRLGI